MSHFDKFQVFHIIIEFNESINQIKSIQMNQSIFQSIHQSINQSFAVATFPAIPHPQPPYQALLGLIGIFISCSMHRLIALARRNARSD